MAIRERSPVCYPANMQRDMDLIRDLLHAIEIEPKYNGTPESWEQPELAIPGYSNDEVAYHLGLLIEAGFVIGNAETGSISRLTWNGHELCDNIKDAGIWAKTKDRLKGLPGVGLTIIAAIAESEIKKHLGLQ